MSTVSLDESLVPFVSSSASLLPLALPTPPCVPLPGSTLPFFLSRRDLRPSLDAIWQHYFADVPRANEVRIAYCRPWKCRLGLIRMTLDNATSFIGINSLLRSPQVPECVLFVTIAHEVAHYAHGFGSPLPRLYDHPHENNVVEQELARRGLGLLLCEYDDWIEQHWDEFYRERRTMKGKWAE